MTGKTYVGLAIVILCALAVVSSTYFYFQTQTLQKDLRSTNTQLEETRTELATTEARLNLPVGKDEAIAKAAGTFDYLNFSRQHFKDPTLRVELASLIWDDNSSQYLWKVELMERKCGCAGNASLNSIVFFIDPVTEEIVSTQEHVATSEQEYARETCEAACHK